LSLSVGALRFRLRLARGHARIYASMRRSVAVVQLHAPSPYSPRRPFDYLLKNHNQKYCVPSPCQCLISKPDLDAICFMSSTVKSAPTQVLGLR